MSVVQSRVFHASWRSGFGAAALICAVFVFATIRAMSGGRGFMCMGGHGQHASDEQAELRREIRELREEIKQINATR